jgi:hypothetical protein
MRAATEKDDVDKSLGKTLRYSISQTSSLEGKFQSKVPMAYLSYE